MIRTTYNPRADEMLDATEWGPARLIAIKPTLGTTTMLKLHKVEDELRARAISAGRDPDKIVPTELVDQNGNQIEMPIWQAYYYT